MLHTGRGARFCKRIAAASLLSALSVPGFAQVVPQVVERPAAVAPSEAGPSQPASVPERLLVEANQSAASLSHTAADAFHRGLLPLSRYVTQLNTVTALHRLDTAPGGTRQMLQQRAAQLREAAGRLEQMRQPAAAGWAADTVLAQMLVLDADSAALAAPERPLDSVELSNRQLRIRGLAETHLRLRLDDFRMGLASMQQLADAAAYVLDGSGLLLSQDEASVDAGRLSQYRTLLTELTQDSREFAARGAGIGRADQVQLATLELALVDAHLARLAEHRQEEAAHLQTAARTARELFETQLQFYATGTADLFDVAYAVDRERRIHQQLSSAQYETDGLPAGYRDRLEQTLRLARELPDRRGQNAASVEYAQALQVLTQADLLE